MTLYMVPLNPGEFSMESIQANKKKVEKEPNNVEALIQLGDANFMIQRFEKSQEFYERALKADPRQVNARIGLSNTYLFLQRTDDSIRQLDKLLEVQKDYPEALFNKGLILLKSKGDAAGAKKAWNRLIETHPDHSMARDVKAEMGRM
ncbi:MAG TPA: tetratricopeptide repeat protein [Nitrospiria bacterium]